MPLWEEIRWLNTLLAFENDITKNIYLCVLGWGCSWHQQMFPFLLQLHEMVSSGTPVGQNSIITTLFPKEMMCFLTWATWHWTLEPRTGNWKNKHTHPVMQYTFYKCLKVNTAHKMCQNHNFVTHTHSPRHQTLLYLAQKWDLAYHSCKNTLFIYTSSLKKKNTIENISKKKKYTVKHNSRIKTVCRDRRSDAGDILQGNWGMLTHNSHSFLCSQSSVMVQIFGTDMRPHFRADSSCTLRPCCHSPRIQVRCIGSRHCETSGTWILPLTRSTVCTGGWTRIHQSRPPCTCFLKRDRAKKRQGFRKWSNMQGFRFNREKTLTFAVKCGFMCGWAKCAALWDHSVPLNIYSKRLRTRTFPTRLQSPGLVLFEKGGEKKNVSRQENPTHSGLLFTLVLILWPRVTARVRKYKWKAQQELTEGENTHTSK